MSKPKAMKKPISKKVKTLNEQLARRRGVLDLPKRFLIVCEDSKSSPSYFEALKKEWGLTAASVRVAHADGHTQPLQIVNKAIEIMIAANNPESGTEAFDFVWCVIDGDYGTKIKNARSRANREKIDLAISTKCFEYWLLLHHEESGAPTENCDELVRTLKHRHIPNYDKGKYDFCDIVKKVHVACARAKKLRKPGIDRGESPEVQNPCSEVYRLIEAILEVKP